MSGPGGADPLDTLAAPASAELMVKGSRFLAELAPVADVEGAEAFVVAARRRHHDARHHCSAFVLGPDAATRRSNDDGETSGTAGAPMLAVLDGAALTDVVAVVTRWFGGTLLGTGGLARAYGGAVSDALAGAARLGRRPMHRFALRVGHAEAGRVEHRLRVWAQSAGDVDVSPGTYGAAGASFEVAVPPTSSASLATLVAEDTADIAVEDLGAAVQTFRRPADERGPSGG